MADGPEMYRLYVECRKRRHEVVLKKVWGPKPDHRPLTLLAVQLTCPGRDFELFTRLQTSGWGILVETPLAFDFSNTPVVCDAFDDPWAFLQATG